MHSKRSPSSSSSPFEPRPRPRPASSAGHSLVFHFSSRVAETAGASEWGMMMIRRMRECAGECGAFEWT